MDNANNAASDPAPGLLPRLGRLLARLLIVAIVAMSLGWIVQRSSAALDRDPSPAGFFRGVLHGAIMPMAMPNLIVGLDVTLYAPNNTGRTYKLGYTAGVNVCGLLFFSYFSWRIRSTRREIKAAL